MKVTLAAACGFCYGVRRAVELAGQAEKGTPNRYSGLRISIVVKNP